MKNHLVIFLSTFFLCFTFLNFSAEAQTIMKVRGKKVMIDLGGESWGRGDKLFGVDNNGKKRVLMQVLQVKNGKAVAAVMKGRAANGMSLILARKGSVTGGNVPHGLKASTAWGFTGSIMMNTMSISNYRQNSVDYSFKMNGTNFGGGLFYDYPLSRDWQVRANGTLEMFNVSKKYSTAICNNSTSANCNASFLQSGLYGTFNYIFTPSPYRMWAGAGGGVFIYLSKSSTVLNTSKFFFNSMLMMAGGLDYYISRNTFIPVSLEYQIIPDKEASVSSMVIRAGWGKSF